MDAGHEGDDFFARLATHWKNHYPGWTAWLLTPDLQLPRRMRLKESRRVPLWNGPIDVGCFASTWWPAACSAPPTRPPRRRRTAHESVRADGAGSRGLACARVLGLQGCPARPGRVDGALHDGVATGMHRNALMDAAFGANQQKISPQEVFWQADLPLPRVQAADEPPRSAASAAASAAPALRLGEEQVTPVLVRPREVIKLNEPSWPWWSNPCRQT